MESTPGPDERPLQEAGEPREPSPTHEPGGTRWSLLVAFAIMAGLGFLIVYSRFLERARQLGVEHPGVGAALSRVQLEPFLQTDQPVTRDDLLGRVTLLNFWGPWCPPCRLEMPHLAEIERTYRSDDQFLFLSVACGTWVYPDLDAMRTETERYYSRSKLEFPVYVDPEFVTRTALETDIGMAPETINYPTTVLVDQDGVVAAIWEGYSDDVPAQIVASIDQLITNPSSRPPSAQAHR